MKINTTTLFLTALMLTAATQPALGMNGLQNNTYVKYGAAIVAGVTLGAGLMYYLTSKPVEQAKPETKEPESQTGDVKGIEKETQTDIMLPEFKKISLAFCHNEKTTTVSSDPEEIIFTRALVSLDLWTQSSNLEVIASARYYQPIHVSTEGISLLCESIRIELMYSKPDPDKPLCFLTVLHNDLNNWGKILQQLYIATEKSNNCFRLCPSHFAFKTQKRN